MESFIKEVQLELIGTILETSKNSKDKQHKVEPTSVMILYTIKDLKKSSKLIVPTDKTNSFELIEIETLYKFV